MKGKRDSSSRWLKFRHASNEKDTSSAIAEGVH
jgi:hypothetical protein